ncbi:metallophosphoesterase [Schnuerera sp. xch1]|uniref:metallophosphoesterase n=1 Tax=Schnuerera sp. xch1 TaxID=2874283 RepID=UPI001CBE1E27|nr:metallophosphoesterase [Schnuerera sp. xch1]MBZ2175474.1 metallophosphoesterase [Schnuerera sp. xch1]
MKIVVISDTHGRTDEVIHKVKNMKTPDLIVHLGDYVEDGEKIKKEIGVRTAIVKGNGDFFNQDYDEDEIVEVMGKRMLLTHGHKYEVRYGTNNLLYRAEELNVDIVLFGHTHIPVIFEESGIIIMNPGSPSIPRGYKRRKTLGIIEIKEKIKAKIIEIDD